jgi:hypothetical protein
MSFSAGAGIRGFVRPLALTAAFVAILAVRAAHAQTVIVRSAPAGSTIEVTMNGGDPVSAKADENGDATLAVPARSDADVQVHVDECGTLVRVLLVARGVQPTAAAPGCSRTDLPSVFLMRGITTFVVDVAGPNTTVHISQGPPPDEWVRRGAAPVRTKIPWGAPGKGLELSAGIGLSSFGNATDAQCGTVTTCETNNTGGALFLAAEYWIKPFVAAEVGYAKPADVTASGSQTGFQFDSHLQTRLFTLGGKVGFPAGPTRPYARGGFNHHQATSTSSETIDDTTVTVDGVTQVVKGGTQSFAQKTDGWNWYLGGGVEVWFAKWIAFYGEVTRLKIKGNPTGGGEGGIDDSATTIAIGARVRLGR